MEIYIMEHHSPHLPHETRVFIAPGAHSACIHTSPKRDRQIDRDRDTDHIDRRRDRDRQTDTQAQRETDRDRQAGRQAGINRERER